MCSASSAEGSSFYSFTLSFPRSNIAINFIKLSKIAKSTYYSPVHTLEQV